MLKMSSTNKQQEKPNKLKRMLVPAAIILGAVLVAVVITATKPKPKKKEVEQQRYMVETITAKLSTEPVILDVMGTVIPAREVNLVPEVSGRIEKLDAEFRPGGYLEKNQTAVFIDSTDYEISLKQKQSELAKAQLDYQLEAGRQVIANQEWELLKGSAPSELDRSLALRQPHLASSQASLTAAKAQVDKARLDIERTQVKAPFNCVVLTKNVDKGSLVNAQTQLATLAGTDEFWVQASIPVDRIKWIQFPTQQNPSGSKAEIFQTVGLTTVGTHAGMVYKLLGDLETKGRMARLIIEVEDPLVPKNGKTPLLLGSYVKARISGVEIKNVFSLPRKALKDGKFIYIADKDDRLKIVEVEPVWKDQKRFFVKAGIENGQRIITSEIPAPIEGRLLLVANGEKDNPTAKTAGGSK